MRSTKRLIAAAVFTTVLLVAGAGYVWAVYESHPMNPVIATDFPDPMVITDGTTYYAFATGVGNNNLQVARSTDFKQWKMLADPLPKLPDWDVGGQAWAPTVAKFGTTWVVYFSAAIDYDGTQCIHTATASTVTGPYTPTPGLPLVCQRPLGGSIDPAVYTANGESWLVWKSDGDHIKQPTAIWSQPLTPDGLAFATNSTPAQLLTDTTPWEAGIVEAPWLEPTANGLVLFFAAGGYDTSGYAIGWATCPSPSGPCTLGTTKQPLITSRNKVAGPGSASIYFDAVNNKWIAYHAWTAPKIGYEKGGVRSLHVDRIDLDGAVPSTDAPTGN